MSYLLPKRSAMRNCLSQMLESLHSMGYDTDPLLQKIPASADPLDIWEAFEKQMTHLPMRSDWPYREPDTLEAIYQEAHPQRPLSKVGTLPRNLPLRIQAAFEARIAGCQLGKAIEVDPSLKELKKAGEATGQWPIQNYVDEAFLNALGRRHEQWQETIRENFCYAAPDDDLNYTQIAMRVLQQHGHHFSRTDLLKVWMRSQSPGWTWGPERALLGRAALDTVAGEWNDKHKPDFEDWVHRFNPFSEMCGALIRVDAYGWAAAGNPQLAANMAWTDAGMTHLKTGVYSSMWVAAALALAPVLKDRREIVQTALQFVPQKSRFTEILAQSIEIVWDAPDWQSAYQALHQRYQEYTHCRIYFECGTLVNTFRFAKNTGDGICMQVMQGNDTDSFGATAGSLLGIYLGPGYLEKKWLKPFGDILHNSLADYQERSIKRLGKKASGLPSALQI